MIEFTVYGDPVGKQAAKAFYNPKAKGRKIIMFSPKNTKDWEQLIRSAAQDHVPDELFDDPLCASVTFYMLKPKSRPKKCLYPDRKPDLDNLEKAVFDALEKVIYTNDSRIVEKHSYKLWGKPRVNIKIEKMEEL